MVSMRRLMPSEKVFIGHFHQMVVQAPLMGLHRLVILLRSISEITFSLRRRGQILGDGDRFKNLSPKHNENSQFFGYYLTPRHALIILMASALASSWVASSSQIL